MPTQPSDPVHATNQLVVSDERGSPRLVVDAHTGAVLQQMDYDEFGRVLQDTNPGLQPFGFAGCLYDPDTKLCHFGARDYDPDTGRWLQKDPILFAGGDTNFYGYVVQDPVNHIDPDGTGPIMGEACYLLLSSQTGNALSGLNQSHQAAVSALEATISDAKSIIHDTMYDQCRQSEFLNALSTLGQAERQLAIENGNYDQGLVAIYAANAVGKIICGMAYVNPFAP